VNRFFIVRSLSLGPDSKPKRYSEPGGRHEHGQEPGEITERDDVELEGTAKVSFDEQGKVSAVTLVSFNETWRRW
jgi:hypothetical protein